MAFVTVQGTVQGFTVWLLIRAVWAVKGCLTAEPIP